MAVAIFQWQDQIPGTQAASYLAGSHGKGQLKDRISRLLRQAAQVSQQPAPPGLQYYADLFGEQVTADAVADLSKYFQFQQARGITFGGLPTGVSPLGVPAGDIRPSNTAIAVIGEALAGWFFMAAGMQPRGRPIAYPTDLVFVVSRGHYALVQVKATQTGNVKARICEAIIEYVQHVSNVQMMDPTSAYACYLVGVVIKGSDDFEILSLHIDIS